MPPRAPLAQLDLLTWQAPAPITSFAPDQVRAANLGGRLSRAVATTLKDCPHPREDIARLMAEYLGEPVPPSALDAYASQAREGHKISACRLLALVQVTGDTRLLQLLAEEFGLCVIDRKYLPLIELAAVREHADEVERRADALRRRAKSRGLL